MSNPKSSIVMEFVNRIFLEYSVHYNSIKQLAQEDVGQKLIDEIHEFLDKKKEIRESPEFKKIEIKDTSNIQNENIHDIIDAFIKFRSIKTLAQIDKKSIEDIMILFNQWIRIGKGPFEGPKFEDIFTNVIAPKSIENLEEQIIALQPNPVKNSSAYTTMAQSNQDYSTITGGDFYSSLTDGGQFLFGEAKENTSNYEGGKAIYKAMRQSNL